MSTPTASPPSSRRISNPKFVGLAYRTHSWPCPRPSDFAILVMYAQDDIHLQLTGDLDANGIDVLAECVGTALAKHPRQLVLDLSGLGVHRPVRRRSLRRCTAVVGRSGGTSRTRRIPKTRFNETLDGLGIFRFHHDPRTYADVLEEAVYQDSQHRSPGIEKERNPGQLRHPNRTSLMTPDFAGRRPDDHQLLVEQRNDLQILFRDRE